MVEFATVARPYAKALFELAEERDQIDIWQQGLAQLSWLMQQTDVRDYINQPNLDSKQKTTALCHLLEGLEVVNNAEFCNFVFVLAQEKRLVILPEIYKQYQQLVLVKDRVIEATIYTAYELNNENQKAEIVRNLEQRFNVRLQAHFETKQDLIGGIKAIVGDQVLDLSVQGKLRQLYTAMTN